MSLQEAIGTLGQQAGDYALTRRLQRCAPRAAADAGLASLMSAEAWLGRRRPRAARAGMEAGPAHAHPRLTALPAGCAERCGRRLGLGVAQPPPARLTARPCAAPGTTCWGTCGARATRRGARPRRSARVRRRSCPRCTWPPRGRAAAAPSSMATGRQWATRCADSRLWVPAQLRPSSARVCTPEAAPPRSTPLLAACWRGVVGLGASAAPPRQRPMQRR